MDEITHAPQIPLEQVPAQPVAMPTLSPVQEPPQNKSFRKVFNISSWIILFALAPLTVLIFLSQDSIPGDFFYPVKRGMEGVILAAASVNPATRAAFRTDLTQARFKEAQSLVISKSNTSGLSTFIDEVQGTQLEVASLKNDTEREKAEEKLINKLEEYQAGLSTLETKTQQNIIAYQFQETVLPTSTPQPSSLPQAQSLQGIPSATPTIIPSPILEAIKNQPKSLPQPTSTAIPLPTSAPLPSADAAVSLVPTVPPTQVNPLPTANSEVVEQRRIAETIKETKEQLHKIRKDLEEKRNEEKEKREKINEEDKANKEESDKKSGTSNRHE